MAIDSGATAWILAATALVMIMTPGVGLFYGGLVRRKNFISMITLSFVAFALVSIQWVVFGYSLAFGPDIGGFIGNLQYLGLKNALNSAHTLFLHWSGQRLSMIHLLTGYGVAAGQPSSGRLTLPVGRWFISAQGLLLLP